MNFSWIEEEERLANLKENSKRENIDQIEIVSIYINKNDEIETIERESLEFTEKITHFTKKQLEEWRDQRIKYSPTTKYVLKDTLLFHVPIEPENIPDILAFSPEKTEKPQTFLTIYPNLLEDIFIPPSIFIFHSLTTLYFCFYEIPNPPPTLVSKRSNNPNEGSKPNLPKKHTIKTVKITIPKTQPNIITKKIRITRKNNSKHNTNLNNI